MEDIDKHVWVMEPEHPSRSNCFRRIALGKSHIKRVYLHGLITILSKFQDKNCHVYANSMID